MQHRYKLADYNSPPSTHAAWLAAMSLSKSVYKGYEVTVGFCGVWRSGVYQLFIILFIILNNIKKYQNMMELQGVLFLYSRYFINNSLLQKGNNVRLTDLDLKI